MQCTKHEGSYESSDNFRTGGLSDDLLDRCSESRSELTEYEVQRDKNIAKNNEMLLELGLVGLSQSARKPAVKKVQKKESVAEPCYKERPPKREAAVTAERSFIFIEEADTEAMICEKKCAAGKRIMEREKARNEEKKMKTPRRTHCVKMGSLCREELKRKAFFGADLKMLFGALPANAEVELERILHGNDPVTALSHFKEKWRGVPKEGLKVAAKLNVDDEEVVVPVLIVGEDSIWKKYVDDLNGYIDMTGKNCYICTSSSTIYYTYTVYDKYCCLGLTENDYELQFIPKEDVCDQMRMQWNRNVFAEFKHLLKYCSLIAAIRCDAMVRNKFDDATQRHDEVFRETKEMFDSYKPFKLIQYGDGEPGDQTHEQLVAGYADDGMFERIEDKDAALFFRLKYRLDGEYADKNDLLRASALDPDYVKRGLPTEPIYRARKGKKMESPHEVI